jgi:hypothetical protein
MAIAIIVLLAVAVAVAISIVRPAGRVTSSAPVDRDRERELAELRALPGYHSDVRLP